MTPQQAKCFRFIDQYWKKNGCAPSYQDMQTELKLLAKSGIHRIVCNLEASGYIQRFPHRARSLEIVKYPPNWPGEAKQAVIILPAFQPIIEQCMDLVKKWHYEPSFKRHASGLGVTLDITAGTVYAITDAVRAMKI